VRVPFDRGDLISRAYKSGEVVSIDHDESGSRIKARVPQVLADELVSAAR
jgi:GTP-binding protein HflX